MQKTIAVLGWIFFFSTVLIGLVTMIILNKYSYQKGYSDALLNAGIPAVVEQDTTIQEDSPTAHYVLNGTVVATNFDSGELKIKAQPLLIEKSTKTAPSLRTITITPQTKITKTILKSTDTLEQERATYTDKLDTYNRLEDKTGVAAPSAPTTTYDQVISLDKININDIVSVRARTDITFAETIEAQEIRVSLGRTTNNIPAPATNKNTIQIPAPAQ